MPSASAFLDEKEAPAAAFGTASGFLLPTEPQRLANPRSAAAFLDESEIPGAEIKAAPTFLDELAAGRLANAGSIAYDTLRRQFSGLLGPTEREKSEQAIAWGTNPDGSVHYEYRPLGNRMEREAGLFTSPFVTPETLATADDKDSEIAKIGKAVYNATAGAVGSLANPGTAILGLAGAGSPALAKVASGAFGVDMATHLPETWDAVQQAEKTPAGSQQRVEAGLNAIVQLMMTHAALKHATMRGELPNTSEEVTGPIRSAADFLDEPEQPSATGRPDVQTAAVTAQVIPDVQTDVPAGLRLEPGGIPVEGLSPDYAPSAPAAAALPFRDDPDVAGAVKIRFDDAAREAGLSEDEIANLSTSDAAAIEAARFRRTLRDQQQAAATAVEKLSDIGDLGSVDNLYGTLFRKLQEGDASEAGQRSAALERAMPEFRAGNIRSASELRDFLNSEDAARTEYEQSLRDDAEQYQQGFGDELHQAIIDAGGLPSKTSEARKPFSGEIDRIEEAVRNPGRPGKLADVTRLFRKDAPDIDELATRLRDRGFDVQTPGDLLELAEQRYTTGNPIYPTTQEPLVYASGSAAPRRVRDYQGDYGAGAALRERSPAGTGRVAPAGETEISRVKKRFVARDESIKQKRELLAQEIEKAIPTAEILGNKVARDYATQLTQQYADAARGGVLPSKPRLPTYPPDFEQNAQSYNAGARHAFDAVVNGIKRLGLTPAEHIYASGSAAAKPRGSFTAGSDRAVDWAANESRGVANAGTARTVAPERTIRQTQQQLGPLPVAGAALAQTTAPIIGKQFDVLADPVRAAKLDFRAAWGRAYAALQRADAAIQTFRKEFDRTPTSRRYEYRAGEPLPRNWEVQRAIDTGDLKNLTPVEQNFAKTIRSLFDEAVAAVQEVSPNSLRDLYENYFPRLWEDPKANASKIRAWMARRPLEGQKGFLKQRVLGDWLEGVQMKLRPAFDNPADMAMAKLGEMWQFVATRHAFQDLRSQGLRKFVYAFEGTPDGWREINDPSSKVYAPPFVTVPEAFDQQEKVRTVELLKSLGIPNERLAKLGGKRWGEASDAGAPPGQIRTRFAGPLSVYWHELGHVLEFRYKWLDTISRGEPLQGSSAIAKELRALADLRAEGQTANKSFTKYIRSRDEKAAVLLEAYVHAPQRMQKVAPVAFGRVKKFIAAHPELQPINEIRPSLALGREYQKIDVGGLVQLGRWVSPEPVARLIDRVTAPGIQSRTWYRGLRAVNGLYTSLRLAGFFHGGMVTNDAQYAAIGLAFNDVLTGKPIRAMKEILKSPAMVPRAWWLGRKMIDAIARPERADVFTRQLAQTAIEANLRTHVGVYDTSMPRMWTRAARELLSTPNTGAAFETLWRAPFAAVAKGMEPVMEHLVPQLKYGMHGMQAARILADHPDADPMTLRDLFAKSADSVEDRLGQVTYDNLFMNRAVKDAGQLALAAMGWHLTKYRGIGGAAADWTRAAQAVARGDRPEVTYRMTYLPAQVIGHALIGGMLHYAFTGRRPQQLIDYMFPASGLIDRLGRPVRFAIADYVKDIATDWTELRQHGIPGLVGAQVSRLAPSWNMLAELYRNADFYNTRIFSDRAPGEPEIEHLLKNLGEGATYLARSAAPFSVAAGQKLGEARTATGENMSVVEQFLLPFVGIVPAKQAISMTPAQVLSQDIYTARMPRGAMTKEQFDTAQMRKKIVDDIRGADPQTLKDLGDAIQKGQLQPGKLTALIVKAGMSPLEFQVKMMPVEDAMKVWDLATDAERQQLRPIVVLKVLHARSRLPIDTRMQYYNTLLAGTPK